MIYWDRPTLKERAKAVLRNSYWMSLLVTLVFAVVNGFTGSGISRFDPQITLHYNLQDLAYSIQQFVTHIWETFWPFFAPVVLVASLIAVAYMTFVVNVAEIGKNRFFTLCRYGSVEMGEILFGFKHGKYMSNVKTMFLRGLYTWLWSLLLVIPGIVKSYSYWMIPYILAENPGVTTERAFEISMKTTQGEKWEMFVLDLSFIGWYLLGVLACGVGVIFVRPYHEAARAELYGALRFKAVQQGLADKSEIGAEL